MSSLRESALIRVIGVLFAASLPAILDPGAIERAALLFPLADSPNPFFQPGYLGLLAVWYPLVSLSAMALILAPGLLLAVALGTARNLGEWLLHGFGFSLVIIALADGVIDHGFGADLRGGAFGLMVLGAAVVAGALCAWQAKQPAGRTWPWQSPGAGVTAIAAAVSGLILLAGLAPKILWEAFNGDGAHGYESTRLLLAGPVPFWPEAAGAVSAFPGLTSVLFVYPGSWFMRLFGELEASVRIPGIFYVLLLYGVLSAVIDQRRARPLTTTERLLVGLPLLAYLLTMAYSATYNPYSADMGLPLTQDTLSMICFLGFVLSFLEGRASGIVAFGILTHLCSPNGLLLIGFWGLSAALVMRPRPWRELRATGLALLACLLLSALVPRLLVASGLPAPGREYAILGLLRRFAFLQVTDWRRVLFVAVPCGLVPLLVLPRFRGQDGATRAISLVALGYFGFFYFQAYISLHHMVPAMLLPIAVFWRHDAVVHSTRLTLLRSGVLAAGILSLALAAPRVWRPDTSGRVVGSTIAVRIPGYDHSGPDVFRHSELLNALFPMDFNPEVPTVYGGSSLTWLFYAERSGGDSASTNYVLQGSSETPPSGMQPIARDSTAVLYVRDQQILDAQRALRPPTPAGSPVYWSPRGLLFRSVPLEDGPYILDVPALLARLGWPVDRWMRRLGVSR